MVWREGVGKRQGQKYAQNRPPELCPHSPEGEHRERGREGGAERRSESLAWEGSPRANPLCPPIPFRNF